VDKGVWPAGKGILLPFMILVRGLRRRLPFTGLIEEHPPPSTATSAPSFPASTSYLVWTPRPQGPAVFDSLRVSAESSSPGGQQGKVLPWEGGGLCAGTAVLYG
jgi:hypothetical protein